MDSKLNFFNIGTSEFWKNNDEFYLSSVTFEDFIKNQSFLILCKKNGCKFKIYFNFRIVEKKK